MFPMSFHFTYIFGSSECQYYQTINSADRKITYGASTILCDSGIGPGWFSFQGAAGKRMSTSCSPTWRCKTHTPSWLNGGHPSVAAGQVNRQVCFHSNKNCCWSSTTITVRNCGYYYVYYFSGTPTCSLRYCGTD